MSLKKIASGDLWVGVQDLTDPLQSPEDSFRINYFLYIVDQVIGSLQKRIDSFTSYEKNFKILFSYEKLNLLDDTSLKANCENLDNILKHEELGDLDGQELYQELNMHLAISFTETKKWNFRYCRPSNLQLS